MSLKDTLKKNNLILNTYKNIRYFICKNFFSDKRLIRHQFKKVLGREVELEEPINFNDKLQWLKLYWYDPFASKCADKWEVRTVIKREIGEEYLNKVYGVFDSVNEIDINNLPNSFVLKATHSSGDNIICKNKSEINWKKAFKRMKKWLNKNEYFCTREYVYKNIKPRIICEKYLNTDEQSTSLTDYKIYCFNGKPTFCQVIQDRGSEGAGTIDFFDTEWNHMEFTGLQKAPHSSKKIVKPGRYDEMLELAATLSKEFPFVRVDFYYVNQHIYFGELTFFPNSGLGQFYPSEWNERIGSLLKLPSKQ